MLNFRGTRITVEMVIQKLSEGLSEADTLSAYQRLCRDDIRASLGYAVHLMMHEDVFAVVEHLLSEQDLDLIARAHQEKRVLITEDKDFRWGTDA